MQSLIGCDLEYAVYQKGEAIPAGLLPISGVKGRPERLKHGGVEIDCCAVETTPDPSNTEDGFTESVLGTLQEVKERFPHCEFKTVPSIMFNPRRLARVRFAKHMGCSPDLNVWTGEMNDRPNGDNGLRSFGGHIHIEGGTQNTIKACDVILGMYSVVKDPDILRRRLYGKAGSYRPKPYPGVEYRVLSNFWCDNEEEIRKIFKLTRMAQELEHEIDKLCDKFGGPVAVQDIINTNKVREAQNILNYFGVIYEVR